LQSFWFIVVPDNGRGFFTGGLVSPEYFVLATNAGSCSKVFTPKELCIVDIQQRSQPRKVYTNIVKIEQKSTVQNFKQVERANMASVGSR
jgi:hypothetical protein